jgi:hypothetical protein
LPFTGSLVWLQGNNSLIDFIAQIVFNKDLASQIEVSRGSSLLIMLRSKRVSPPALVILSRRLLFAIPTNSINEFIRTTDEYMAFL